MQAVTAVMKASVRQRECKPRQRRRKRRGKCTPSIETVKLRSLPHDGTSLITSLVDAPAHHPDGDDRESDGLDEEKRAKLARVEKAEGESVAVKRSTPSPLS
jgi:hypothetical protein